MPSEPATAYDPLESSLRSLRWLLLVTPIIALGEIWIPDIEAPPTNLTALVNTFLCVFQVTSACLGVLGLYLVLPQRRKELIGVVMLGAVLEAALFPTRLAILKAWGYALIATGAGFGLISGAAILYRTVTARGREQRLAAACLISSFLFPFGALGGAWISRMAHFAQPQVYDTWAYALDSAAGFSPSFLMASVVTFTPATSMAFYTVYSHLSLFMVLAAALCLTRGKQDGLYFDPLTAFTTAAIAGSLMYNLWPLTGPGNLFGNAFHGDSFVAWSSPPPTTDLRTLTAPLELSRRAMPSMHATFCLLAALTMVRNRRRGWGVFAWAFFAMTLISAGYIGHYAIDFVVALPLTLVNLGLTGRRQLTSSAARCQAMAIGLAMLSLCYYGFLRQADFLIAHPHLTLLAQIAIIATFVISERRLANSVPEN